MSKDDQTQEIMRISDILQKEIGAAGIADGTTVLKKDSFKATLPENLKFDDWKAATEHSRNVTLAFNHALGTTAHPEFVRNEDLDVVTGTMTVGYDKFASSVKRSYTPPIGDNPETIKGLATGGFKLNIPSPQKKAIKASLADLYKDL